MSWQARQGQVISAAIPSLPEMLWCVSLGSVVICNASNPVPCDSCVGGKVEGFIIVVNFSNVEKLGHQYRIPCIDSDHDGLLLKACAVLVPERYTAGVLRERRVGRFWKYLFDIRELRWSENFLSWESAGG